MDKATRSPRSSAQRDLLRWSKRGFLVLLLAGIVFSIVDAFRPKAIAVEVAAVRRGSLEVFVEEDGRTRVKERWTVSAPASGDLTRITLDPGDAVREGDVIATLSSLSPTLLDPRTRAEASARLDQALERQRQARASVARAKAAHELAARDLARIRPLAEQSIMKPADLEKAELNEKMAAEELAAAQIQERVVGQEIVMARAVLGQTKGQQAERLPVHAPTSGIILRVLKDDSGPVTAGTPLIEIGDLNSLEVVVDLLSQDAVLVRPGARAKIQDWGGETIVEGIVDTIEPSAFTRLSALGIEEQRVNVIIKLENRPDRLGDGFRVEAEILTWRGENVLAVPRSALFRHGSLWALYVVDQGRARRQIVELGHRSQEEVEVLKGLTADEPVILYPGDRVKDGDIVEVTGE